MIKALTFDFWSTLYQSQTPNYSKRLLSLKTKVEQASDVLFSIEAFQEATQTARTIWTSVWQNEQRTIGAKEWVSILLSQLNVSVDPTACAEIEVLLENSVFYSYPTVAEEIPHVLQQLSTRYRLGIISDTGLTPGRILRQILTRDHLVHYFTHLTFSDELGRSKPHPTAFLSTLKALQVEPAEAVHIGDLLRTDIAGAQQVGMKAVQYVGFNSKPQLDGVTPDAIIYNHTELNKLLKVWNGD